MKRYDKFKVENSTIFRSTVYPSIPHSENDKYIITRDSDRLDLLAKEFYGDQRQWWILADANNIGKGTLNVEPGLQIRIPFPIRNLKDKNFPEVRKWVVDNLDNDSSVLLRRLYDSLYETLIPNSIPAAVLIIAKYQYQIAFVADQEINLLAALTEIMVECQFK